jgi:hypothetical protein
MCLVSLLHQVNSRIYLGGKMKLLVRMMLCLMISFTLIQLPIIKSAHAGMIATNEAVEIMTRAQSHQKVSNFIDRKDVQEQLVKLGVSPQEATKRLAGLSDAELRKIAGEIDKATIGGDVGGILVLVLLVLLIIYFAKRI